MKCNINWDEIFQNWAEFYREQKPDKKLNKSHILKLQVTYF